MFEHEVDYADLPLCIDERLSMVKNLTDDSKYQDHGKYLQIPFDESQQKSRAGSSKPLVGTLKELKLSFLHWLLSDNKPELLSCKIETYMRTLGHKILWTPPYCPKLQPIELYWACGKNHVALQNKYNMTMRDVVSALRIGWYGNQNEYPKGHPKRKQAVDCRKLWGACMKNAGTIYVPICDRILSEIGSLVIEQNHNDDLYALPINTLVLDLTKEDIVVDETSQAKEV